MDNDPHSRDDEHARVDEIVARGPTGAFAVAAVATAIVVLMYFAFYLFIYLPRGAVQ
jgi:phosphatidylglycerophosphatase A